MQLSSSAGSLTGRPRSLVVPRGTERSWSSPALAAAFSLRKYAVEVKHIPGERAARAFQGDALEIPIEKIDLIGGNGKWRQLKAEEEFKRRRQEEEEQHRQELIKAAQKKKRQAELAERKRRQQEDEERRWQEEREQKRRDQEERERVKTKQEERVRQDREEAEEERRRRMPRTCETCEGSTKCQECMGKGYLFHVFLVHSVAKETDAARTSMEHGRVYQGCDKCGGYAHNMLGEVKKGSGLCAACNGLGKIWPVLESQPQSPKAAAEKVTKGATQIYGQSERAGEVKL